MIGNIDGGIEQNRRILVASSTERGAVQLVPVIKKLMEKGSPLKVLSSGETTGVFRSARIECEGISVGKTKAKNIPVTFASKTVAKAMLAVLEYRCGLIARNFNPKVVLTSTNIHQLNLEQTIWRVVRTFSVALMNPDSTGSELNHFSELNLNGVSEKYPIKHALNHMPHMIAVLDEAQKGRMQSMHYALPDATYAYISKVRSHFAQLPLALEITNGVHEMRLVETCVSEKSMRVTGNPADGEQAAQNVADLVLSYIF